MKKVLLTAVVSALLVASCSQEEVVENVSNPQLISSRRTICIWCSYRIF